MLKKKVVDIACIDVDSFAAPTLATCIFLPRAIASPEIGLNEIARSEGAKRILGSTKNSLGQIYVAFNLARGNK